MLLFLLCDCIGDTIPPLVKQAIKLKEEALRKAEESLALRSVVDFKG